MKGLHSIWQLRVNENVQPLGTRSAYNTIIEDPGSPYVATFQCIITSCLHQGTLHFYDSKQRPTERTTLLCFLICSVRAKRMSVNGCHGAHGRLQVINQIHLRKKWHNLFCLQHLLKQTCSVVSFRSNT